MGRAAKSGSRVPHLQRRHGTFHLRVRVPDDLRVRVGLREVRRSLHVHTFAEARPLALKYAARVMEVFEMIRASELTKDRIGAMIVDRFSDLERAANGGRRFETRDRERELEYVAHLTEEAISEIEAQRATGDYRYPVVGEVLHLLAKAGVAVSDLPQDVLDDMHDGVARALIERDRLVIYRLSERLLPYQPVDPLFRRAAVSAVGVTPPEWNSTPVLGPTLGEALDVYLGEGKRMWSPKTWKGRACQLDYLREHIGAETPIAAITAQHIVSYRDALRRLRPRSMRAGGESFLARQTSNEDTRISATTVENLFNPCRAFFRWAKGQQGYISVNPAEDVRLPRVKKAKGVKSRRPFTAEELRTIFSAPVFTGMKTAKRRFEPGSVVIKDAHFWIPILGYYTGARLGELVQLHLADVRLDDPVPHFVITEEGSAERGTGEEKMVKSHAGVRRVPIHQDVLDLGFGDFIQRRLQDKRPHKRVFWQVGFGADGQPSTVFSKWFARLLDKVGLKDPALVFHSFRHTAEDAFRNALLPQYVIDRIIGHAGGNTSDGYGDGVSLTVCENAVKEMKLTYRVRDRMP
jgi:integrase